MDFKKIATIAAIANLVILDVGVGYLVYKSPSFAKATPGEQITNINKTEYVDKCGEECKIQIASEVAKLKLLVPSPVVTPKTVYQTAPKQKVRSVTYVTVPGNGETLKMDWVDVAGSDFYFNLADYSGFVEAYFEANIKLINGGGMAYARLYDSTYGIGVQGGEVQTKSNTTAVVESGKLNFWAGKNLMRVQIKSLTSEPAVFETGRIRVVTEN